MLKLNPFDDWCVGFGRISETQEMLWRDERFAVLAGRWEFCPAERFVVVGEIDLTNRSDLVRDVQRHRYLLDDSLTNQIGLVAVLWSIHGTLTPGLLRGAYAFSVWDRYEQTLSLVRDRVGVKTLYYSSNGAVRYAGQRAAVAGKVSREIDFVALRDYLCCAFVPGAQTMLKDVHEVRPGTIVRLPGAQTTVYWQVAERFANEKGPLSFYSSRLRSALEQSVSDSLPFREPVGVFLSGGLDSSCVAALAALLHNDPVNSYSIHFGRECPNELEFSALVAEHVRTKHHVIEITPDAMWDLLPETMAQLDDPIGDPLTVPNLILGRQAKKSVNTILNGEGGDPCFGGPKNQPMLLNKIYSTTNGVRDGVVQSYLASFQKCANDLPVLLRPEVWEQVREQPSAFEDAFAFSGSYLNNLMFINTRFKGADQILTKVDNLTRAVGLRGRSPLFDDRLVELSLEIPPEYKLEGACEKAVLKAAVGDLLPQRIPERPKSGMMVPVQKWFREYWHRRASVLLLSQHARTKRFLNQNVIRDWLNYRGDVWARYGVKLWLLVSVELWLQAHTRT